MIELNPQNCVATRERSNAPRITFTKNGSIYFNKPAAKMMKLQKNSEVVFLLDNGEILVARTNGGFGMTTFRSTQTGFSNIALRKKIADFLGLPDDRTFRLNMKPEPIKKKGYEMGCFELDKKYK